MDEVAKHKQLQTPGHRTVRLETFLYRFLDTLNQGCCSKATTALNLSNSRLKIALILDVIHKTREHFCELLSHVQIDGTTKCQQEPLMEITG